MISMKTVKEVVMIMVGTSIYAFGLVYLNIANHLAFSRRWRFRDHFDLTRTFWD